MQSKMFLSGNEAVAWGVKLARPHVIAAYPITPQTIVIERLSEMIANGKFNAEYLHVESEHSALSAMMGASAIGARTFTATSSQGLLYMAECLHYASGGRFPIVMMNANRSLALPWSIYGDQRDSLSLLDCGWIQVYAEDAQESLDLIIQAYIIAEDQNVLTPVMVNLDGFVLTILMNRFWFLNRMMWMSFFLLTSIHMQWISTTPKTLLSALLLKTTWNSNSGSTGL
jgi:pyruvate ferredoxin oxidoreductase alpha subunit